MGLVEGDRMDQLSGLDATFVYLETPEMPMHVGAMQVFVLPKGYKGRFVSDLRRHIQHRLPLIPVFRRKLWWMPLNLAAPAWVDAEPDLREHVVEVKLPKQGRAKAGIEQMEREVARLHMVLLDRKRPLWKYHVFEGLAPDEHGHRLVGVYMQLHHAAVDGQAAVALSNVLFDLSADPAPLEIKASSRQRVYKLEMAEMLRGVLGHQAQQVGKMVRELPATIGTLNDAAKLALARSRLGGERPSMAPVMPINGRVGTTRAFTGVSLPLGELKALGKAHGATINDMVLLVCASALRRFYAKRRALPKKSMIAAVPVSLRAKGDTTADNQAGMSVVGLGTDIADPAQRLAHIRAATDAMKATLGSVKSIVPTDFPSLGVPWLLEALTLLVGKTPVKDHMPQAANLTISNVPGPQKPLYMAGARMVGNFPTSIVVHGSALNITVQSYAGSLDFGLIADGQALPEVRELADAITIAFDDVRAMPLPEDESAAAAEPAGTLQRVRSSLTRGVAAAVGQAGKMASASVKRVAAGAATVSGDAAGSRAPAPKAKPRRLLKRSASG
jgi:WS/DGAT/MGAT family acyltransferase